MITKLILGKSRRIIIHTGRSGRDGGIRFEGRDGASYFSLSVKEQARLAHALTDHRNRKVDEIKEMI